MGDPMYFGYGRISMQILEAFGTKVTRLAVGRILRKNIHTLPSGDGKRNSQEYCFA